MGTQISDEVLGIFVPILVYWIYSIILTLMEHSFPKYKMQTVTEQEEKNMASKRTVIKGVLLQQFLQAVIAALLFMSTSTANDIHAVGTTAGATTGAGIIMSTKHSADSNIYSMLQYMFDFAYNLMKLGVQFVTAMLTVDTWQYFMHRYMHKNQFLYKHIHSHHHKLVAPYAYGALYNHPLEGLLVDTMSGAISFLVSGMSPRTSIFFFSFATMKAVDDHSGLWIPWNPFHLCFINNSAYHAIHHQLHGTKYNFSQPFFVIWDKILGTCYMPQVDENKNKKQK